MRELGESPDSRSRLTRWSASTGQTVVAQPVHVQQLLKLKQQAVQQQKAIQPQAAPGPAAVQQKVPGSRAGSRPSCLHVELGPAPGHGHAEDEAGLSGPGAVPERWRAGSPAHRARGEQ